MITVSNNNQGKNLAFKGTKRKQTLRMMPIGNNSRTKILMFQSAVLSRLLVVLSIIGAGLVSSSCGSGNNEPIDPPATKVTLNDEFMKAMQNMYAISPEEIAAGKIKNDTTSVINEGNGSLTGIKKMPNDGDSIVIRVTDIDPATSTKQGVGIVKFYKNAGDAEGSLKIRSYNSPRLIYNNAKMKFNLAAQLFTKDKLTDMYLNGKKHVSYNVEELGKVVKETVADSDVSSLIKRVP